MRRGVYLFILLIVVIVSSITCIIVGDDVHNLIPFVVCAAIFLVFFFLFVQQNSEYKGRWYKPSNVFMLGFFIVSFQYLIDYCIGYKSLGDFYISSSVGKMATTCLFGLIAFIIGYVASRNYTPNRDPDKPHFRLSTRFLELMQIVFFVGWISTVNIVALLTGYGYFEDVSGSASANFESLFYDATLAILVIVVINNQENGIKSIREFLKKEPIIFWVIISIYCVIRLISGDRGPCLYMALAVFFAYKMLAKSRIKLFRIIVFFIAAAIVLNVVGVARSLSLNMSFSERIVTASNDLWGQSQARFSNKTIFPITEELAMSNRCNQIAINLIDNGSDTYHYGKYCFYQVLQCIPFVPSFLHNTLKIPEDELSANIKMTDVYYGQHNFSQIGTTVVADSYFDFGVVGVIIMLLLCGFVFKKVDSAVCLTSPTSWLTIAIVLLFASMAIYIPRSTLIIQLKQLIPICVLLIVNNVLFQRRPR